MARFPPSNSVLRSVKMTRTAYAQLVGQKFYPPKVFGRWEEREGTKEWRWKDIGMKIVRSGVCAPLAVLLTEEKAVGFEMLYQESKSRQSISAEQLRSSVSCEPPLLLATPPDSY